MRSIKRFLTVVTVAAITLVTFAAMVQGYRKGIDQTQQQLDQQLQVTARLLAGMSTSKHRLSLGDSGIHYQRFNSDGVLLDQSVGAPDMPEFDGALEGVADMSFDGRRWRVLNFWSSDRSLMVQVAEPVGDRFTLAEQIVNATLLPILIGIPVLAVMTWIIITVGLRHLKALAWAVSERGTDNLNVIEMPGVPRELESVVVSMNGLLAQLDQSFERERRFASDAAHELRTPLSALKVNVYNLSKQLHGSTDIDDLFNSLNRMSHLIDQLLLLYRASSENLRTEFEKVDLHALCQMIIQDRYETIAQREQEIELIGDATVILGNEFALSAMISNLIDNASKYSDRGGSILVKLSPQAGRYVLSVEDSGIGIPETLRKRVLDRFFRVNSGSPIQGCGLGLSIVQHVAVLHHANLAISDSSFETGTCVSLSFPYYASSLYS
ncbi:MAG: sensor histidine kinase [Halieaceae bacterium]|nr:sensor histidine kinase [Halieaceae bacterium]